MPSCTGVHTWTYSASVGIGTHVGIAPTLVLMMVATRLLSAPSAVFTCSGQGITLFPFPSCRMISADSVATSGVLLAVLGGYNSWLI